jgi:hypothetical protein
MWGENVGWINLSCLTNNTCEEVSFGVKNDGTGTLSGYAWAENAGWINFAPAGGGVQIDPGTGLFSGLAWGENTGWINFAPNTGAPKTGWHVATTPPDGDSDGIADALDNCPTVGNPFQSNIDGDGDGDLCDICPADNTNSCDPNGSGAAEVSVAAGGTVVTPGGKVLIDVDPGDMAGDTTLSVTKTTTNNPDVNLTIGANPGLGQAIGFYELEPDGVDFANAVTLTIMIDVTSLNATQRARIDLYRLEDTNGDGVDDTFVPLGAVCNVNEGPVGTFIAACTAELNHFSTHAIIAPRDSDGDGVPDNFDGTADACPGTLPGASVDPENGCSVAQLVDCDTDENGEPWKNHGDYVSRYTAVTRDFVLQGLITKAAREFMLNEAAQSDCGKSK